jgi:hypothetical protein
MRGSIRGVILLLAIVFLTPIAVAQIKPDTGGIEVEPIDISAHAIDHFEKSAAGTARFGRLEWRGGLVLSSSSPNFGGWSGLTIDGEGRLVAVSDAGTWMTADLVWRNGRPTGLTNAKLGPLLALRSNALKRPRDRDAEATALLEGGLGRGTLLISFENNHRIGRFEIDERGVSAPLGYMKRPGSAARMSKNQGFEAVGVLRAGAFKGAVIAIAERFLDERGHHTGWLWVKGEPQPLYLVERGGYDITDAASLPDGDLLVLERRFRWLEGVRVRLRLIKAGDIAPGAILDGEILLEADMAYEIDNMEGLAVHRGTRGETLLTLISDDNFNSFLQRTVLLQFALTEGPLVKASGP